MSDLKFRLQCCFLFRLGFAAFPCVFLMPAEREKDVCEECLEEKA